MIYKNILAYQIPMEESQFVHCVSYNPTVIFLHAVLSSLASQITSNSVMIKRAQIPSRLTRRLS